MSKAKKSGKKQTKNFGDVTLNDFANSTVTKYRAKKSASNVGRVLKKLEEDEIAWDEKTEGYEGEFVQTENEDGTVSYVITKSAKKTSDKNTSVKHRAGYDFPLDIWYLISEYIRPEDVGRFAGICRSSFEVVCSAKFWFGLYKRYYRTVPNLPERFQPECMTRFYGARTSVIRSLFYMYPPFVERLQCITTFEKHPDCLRRRQCVSMWHQKQSHWYYYFKLKEKFSHALPRELSRRKPDLIEMLEDVSANADENCRILQVTCEHFIAVPLVQGLVLTSVTMSLSHGLRHHRLHLGFGSGVNYSYRKLDGGSTSIIVFDPVLNVKVLDWWHPLYPHNHNIELLCNED